MLKRKIVSVFLALLLLASSGLGLLPAFAAEESAWVELLETETVNDSGNNLVTFSSTSTTFRIKTPQYMRCTKVDMLITHPSGYAPTSVKVRYNNVYYTLTMAKIDSCTTRVYGDNIPDNLYADLVFQINKSGSVSITYQILSCRVSSLTSKEFKATAYSLLYGEQYNTPFSFEYDNPDVDDMYGEYQFPIVVTDWQKFDKITISGSVGAMALNSVRCTIGGLGLPYEMNYAVSNISGSDANSIGWTEMKYYSYDESYKGTTETEIFTYTEYLGKILFSITIDLSGVDRTSTEQLICYFTCLANEWLGYTIQITGVTGFVDIADTSDVSWWTRFKTFLTGLFDPDSPEAEDFQSSADQQGQQMEDLNEQLDSVTKPPVSDIETDLDDYVDPNALVIVNGNLAQLTNNSLIVAMLMISLIIALLSYILFGKR